MQIRISVCGVAIRSAYVGLYLSIFSITAVVLKKPNIGSNVVTDFWGTFYLLEQKNIHYPAVQRSWSKFETMFECLVSLVPLIFVEIEITNNLTVNIQILNIIAGHKRKILGKISTAWRYWNLSTSKTSTMFQE